MKTEHKKSAASDIVTASFGVTTVRYLPEITIEDIISKVDKLLYKAKVQGRNRIDYDSQDYLLHISNLPGEASGDVSMHTTGVI